MTTIDGEFAENAEIGTESVGSAVSASTGIGLYPRIP